VLDLSIIIVNWNGKQLLERCLRTVYAALGALTAEVIVVDNASTDGSAAAVRAGFPQVTLVENGENVGFAAGNNQALRRAQGRYVLLLNTDAFVHPGALEALVRHMDAYPDTGAAGGRLLYEDGRLQRSCSSFPTLSTELWTCLWLDRLFPAHPVFGKYLMTYWDLDDLREVDAVLGAVMILRQTALQKVGLLDEQFFMYSEEVDLCYRLKQAGWSVRFVPDATATHLWGGSVTALKKESFLWLHKSRMLFFRKHYGRPAAALYKLILLLSSLLRGLLLGSNRRRAVRLSGGDQV